MTVEKPAECQPVCFCGQHDHGDDLRCPSLTADRFHTGGTSLCDTQQRPHSCDSQLINRREDTLSAGAVRPRSKKVEVIRLYLLEYLSKWYYRSVSKFYNVFFAVSVWSHFNWKRNNVWCVVMMCVNRIWLADSERGLWAPSIHLHFLESKLYDVYSGVCMMCDFCLIQAEKSGTGGAQIHATSCL